MPHDAPGERWLEKVYPLGLSLLAVGLLRLAGFTLETSNIGKLIDLSTNLASIIVGLLATLLAIILSLNDAPGVKFVLSSVHKGTIYSYTKYAIASAFIAIVLGAAVYPYVHVGHSPNIPADIVFCLWVGSSINLLLAAYRIINVLLRLLAIKDYPIDRPKRDRMDREAVKKLKEQTGRHSPPL